MSGTFHAKGMRQAAAVLLLAAACARNATVTDVSPISLGVTGTVRFHGRVASRYVAPRNVEVWLPPEYDRDKRSRYPVIYVHDGQNVFAPATSFLRVDWGVDETMTRLVAEKRVRAALIVAIWNTADRIAEYTPQRSLADAYLRFIVDELKPFIDSAYRTRSGRDQTFLMGSSMGGLISLYGVLQYPQVFGGAACLSTHWPAADGATVAYVAGALPRAGSHRFYFDHGTATLDTSYAPWQERVDAVMRAAGYTSGVDWITKVFPGADHSERSWRVRVNEPLEFLLGRP